MALIVVIPSRYGSSRFEGKPLTPIGGKPMIQRVFEQCRRCPGVSRVAVATDDTRIADAVASFGGESVMTSTENRSGTDRVAEAAERLGVGSQDIVANVQGDQPLLDPRCLEQLVRPFSENPGLAMSTLAYRIRRQEEITNPKDVKVTFDRHGDALYFSRSSIPYCREPFTPYDVYKHLGVYAYSREFLEIFRTLPSGILEEVEKLEQLRALEWGYRIRVVVTEYDSPEVDLPEDVLRIEEMIRSGY